ncbi:thioredoxin-like 1-1, chloroplastic [Cynara cardunculus var. scolymus]|uniref:thioredoxin-like 1-1, chloroplastic n=1 Tax=Cynara cardunculus var. scolymus TaxID=59895 RepID=UPI000D62DFA2|nr:thioredoxin-like 1-1, chloroplastic [Cynara cardunculus var. scolymus]
MAEIIGKISSNYRFSASNHDYSRENLKKLSPVMIKMPAFSSLRASLTVRSSAGGEIFDPRVNVKMSNGIGKSVKWWEKGIKPNMKEVTDAEELVESLLNAGDKLVVVGFFSPGCGGCKALHPKLCQLAEMNPDVQFLLVNHEDHKSMCYSLNVHVLPFFRFYRGAHGRLCSFSCTNATIKKFKDALAKHTPDRCSLGPPKGLEEKELLALASNRDLSFTYSPNPNPNPNQPQEMTPAPVPVPVARSRSVSEPSLPLPRPLKPASEDKDRSLVS